MAVLTKLRVIRHYKKSKMWDDEKEIIGIIFPLTPSQVENLFRGLNIISKFFLKKSNSNTSKIKKNIKVYFYKTQSDKTIVGEGVIQDIEFLKMNDLIKRFREKLATPIEDLKEYVGYRTEIEMLTLILKDIIKYSKPIKMEGKMSLTPRYVTRDKPLR